MTTHLRILLADDNADALLALETLMKLRGHTVCTAMDGHAALLEAERCRPQVAILDIDMPGLDGHAVARQLRQTDWGTQMILIALSGGAGTEKRSSTFNHRINKPADIEQLADLFED